MVIRLAQTVDPEDFWFAAMHHFGPSFPNEETTEHWFGYGYTSDIILWTGPWLLVPTEEQAIQASQLLYAVGNAAEIGCAYCNGENFLSSWIRFHHLVRGPHSFLSAYDPWPWLLWPPKYYVGLQ